MAPARSTSSPKPGAASSLGAKRRRLRPSVQRTSEQTALIAECSSKPGAGSAALFTSIKGTRVTTDAIADIIKAVTWPQGLDDDATSHVLRRTFGIELTRDGVDIVNGS